MSVNLSRRASSSSSLSAPPPLEPVPPSSSSSGHNHLLQDDPFTLHHNTRRSSSSLAAAAPDDCQLTPSSNRSGRTTPASLHTPTPSLLDPHVAYTESLRRILEEAAAAAAAESEEEGDDARMSLSVFTNRISLYSRTPLEKVGEGTFGEVFKAVDPQGNIVAVKKIKFQTTPFGFPLNLLRELCLLQRISHECLLPLLDVFPDHAMLLDYSSTGMGAFWMVFPFMDHDLAGLVDACREKTGKPFTERQTKYYMKKIMEGILYLHKNKIIHRDLKCANILVSNDGDVRICDFGLARTIAKQSDYRYTDHVVTRWYRAPELLLGSRQYTPAIDIWAAGCIFAEMMSGQPLFKGQDDIDMLDKVFQVCGTPDDQSWKSYRDLANSRKFCTQQSYTRKLRDVFSQYCDPLGLDLLDRMLTNDPAKRITAHDAYFHDYFWRPPFPLAASELPHYNPSYELFTRRKLNPKKRKASMVSQ